MKQYCQTWREASEICVANEIKSQEDYIKRYSYVSTKLHSRPSRYYLDFPGWPEFLQRKNGFKTKYYHSWQMASRVCKEKGIKNMNEYYQRRAQVDKRLPEMPRTFYKKKWPGDDMFFGE